MSNFSNKTKRKLQMCMEDEKCNMNTLSSLFNNMNLQNNQVDDILRSMSFMNISNDRQKRIRRRLKGVKQPELTQKEMDELFDIAEREIAKRRR